MDSMSAGELARATERIADALEAIRTLMFEKNELLKQAVEKQGEANDLTKGLTELGRSPMRNFWKRLVEFFNPKCRTCGHLAGSNHQTCAECEAIFREMHAW